MLSDTLMVVDTRAPDRFRGKNDAPITTGPAD